MKVKLLTDTAIAPRMMHPTDAAFDLYADEDVFIEKGDSLLVSVGISIAIPLHCSGQIWPRSGLAVKHGLTIQAGLIDPGYRGEVKALLHPTATDFHANKGDRIAQLLIVPIERPEIEIVDILDTTDRGNSGFGSTGTNKLDLDKAEFEI